jgi:hypothetical protein
MTVEDLDEVPCYTDYFGNGCLTDTLDKSDNIYATASEAIGLEATIS